jgi:hypothetical protein
MAPDIGVPDIIRYFFKQGEVSLSPNSHTNSRINKSPLTTLDDPAAPPGTSFQSNVILFGVLPQPTDARQW